MGQKTLGPRIGAKNSDIGELKTKNKRAFLSKGEGSVEDTILSSVTCSFRMKVTYPPMSLRHSRVPLSRGLACGVD